LRGTVKPPFSATVSLHYRACPNSSLLSHCAPLREFRQVVLICPMCHAPLHRIERSLACPRGHSFDVAREGYVNLLRSNHPGDTREMLAARRRFLERGYFAPIARRLCEVAASHLTSSAADSGNARSVVDAGCGEGYYLGLFQQQLRANDEIEVQYLGVDSSREACRMAAQRHKEICFAVSDLKDLIPVADSSVDLLLNVFAPRSVDEFTRVLRPSGLVVVVIPQPSHLGELRSTFPLIGIEGNKADHLIYRFEPSLRLIHREPVEYELVLEPEAIIDLIGMSPSQRHLTEPLRPLSGPLSVTVSTEILTFRRAIDGAGPESVTSR
jgi:23S rRNA (guanine745-N1)-methyltransferase